MGGGNLLPRHFTADILWPRFRCVRSQERVDIDAATRARVIDAAIAKIDEFYVFPDVAKKMGMAVRLHAKRGEPRGSGY